MIKLLYLALLSIITSMLLVLPSSGQSASDIGFLPENIEREQPSRGPSAVTSFNGRLVVGDDVNQLIKVFSGPDLSEKTAEIPYPHAVEKIGGYRVSGDNLEILGEDGRIIIAIDLLEVELDPGPTVSFAGTLSDDDRTLVLTIDGNDVTPLVASSAEKVIVDWQYIGQFQNQSVILINETEGSDLSANIYTIGDEGAEFIGRFSWSIFEYLPEKPFHLSKDGVPWIFGLKDGVWSHRLSEVLEIDRSLSTNPDRRKFFEEFSIRHGSEKFEDVTRRQQQIFDDTLSDRSISDYTVIDTAMLRYSNIVEFPLRAPAGITRETAVARALAYYSIPFFYRNRNARNLGAGWRKPTNLVGQVGTWQRGFRYYWSGYMSLKRHQEGLVAGHAVGDIDTGTIISSGIVGCDCSGCVSAWLGIKRHTTRGISNDPDGLFTKVKINDTRPGDIFNKRGSHVRMLLNKIKTDQGYRFRMIESAKSCDGVCIQTYTAAQLGAYTPLTYNKFLN